MITEFEAHLKKEIEVLNEKEDNGGGCLSLNIWRSIDWKNNSLYILFSIKEQRPNKRSLPRNKGVKNVLTIRLPRNGMDCFVTVEFRWLDDHI